MALQLLEHQKKSGTKTYRYYSIAEPYREEGRNKKRVISHLGKLTAEQVLQIRQALRITQSDALQVVDPRRIQCTTSWRFLDLSVFHLLWRQLGLESVLDPGEGDVELGKLMEILVLNRCTEPESKLGVTRWYGTTYLETILGVDSNAVSESRLYRCLPSIDAHQRKLEQAVFERLIRPDHAGTVSLYFYDLTSSYFEGHEVPLGRFSQHSKDHRPDCLQVVLALLINEKGYPFTWDVFAGNQGDAPTLKGQIQKFRARFGIEHATLVFDRGFLSQDNLALLEGADEASGYHYLTGLDAPQIELLLDLRKQDWIREIHAENAEERIEREPGWKRFDESQFYYEVGIVNNRRTILMFDVSRYRLSVLGRQKKIDAFREWVHKHNEWLAGFKKDAERGAIESDVRTEIKRRHLSDYVNFELHEYRTENQTFIRTKNNPYPSQGHLRQVRSFQIVITENNRERLDGVFALITSPRSPLDSEGMLMAYRQKYLIEAAFREMKSILKLRPWFVHKDAHVRAHYTICVLGYLMERMLDRRLEESGAKADGWTLTRFKEALAERRVVEIEIGSTLRRVLQRIPDDLVAVLKKMDLGTASKLPDPH
jgi:transposase